MEIIAAGLEAVGRAIAAVARSTGLQVSALRRG